MKIYLGIDVSKNYADFALIDEQKQPLVKNFQLDDTPDGHIRLGEFIHELFKQHPDLTVVATALSFMCAMEGIRHNPIIKDLYAHSLAKGKSKMSIIDICMHKLLRIIYGVLKSGKAFDPAIDQADRTSPTNQAKSIKQEIWRFQPLDENAPVSARQNKQKKEQSQSQGELVTICEIKAQALSHCTT
ncbi:MAG TPA: hypothetical protein PKI62_04985 [bacterium]|nr:hypothetical protein [bacterium]HPR87314.1 hypothetical protein [bacterium]